MERLSNFNSNSISNFHTSLRLPRHLLAIVLLLALLAVPATGSFAQDVVRLTGKVTLKGDGEPLTGVNITDPATHRAVGTTDLDGRFAFNVRVGTTLKFSMVGMKPRTLKVKDQKYVELELEEDDISVGEVVVQTKRITDRIMPEPTDIEVKGNWFHVRTRVRVPREMFGHDTRLVVQPVLNNATSGELRLMRPMVYDAPEYNMTQDRMYNFRMADSTAGDPLARYVTVKSRQTREKGRTNDIIGYADSIYVENVKDDYSCDVYMAIENYNRILYRDTTIIARGTVNPLRWLDYSFAARPVTDPSYLPKPEKQMRDSKGEVSLRFPVGKWTFNASDPQNAAELDKLRLQIDAISRQKDATLQSLDMEGFASPEGKYKWNMTLAQKRMNSVLAYMRGTVPEDLRRGMTFTSKAAVAPWTEVSRLMHADGHHDEATLVDNIIGRFPGSIDRQTRSMYGLPFYYKLIDKEYLPQLRRVGYTMHYTIFRQLTHEEIEELYAKDYRQLTRFEFYELYSHETDPSRRETIMRQALEVYPSFMVAANDLAAALVNRREADPALLRPFVGGRAPQEVNSNQMIALLEAGLYSEADSIAPLVPESDDTRLLHAVNSVLNGRYDGNFDVVAKTGLRNEVVMLLAMKRNEEALKLSRQLPEDEALSYYLRAVCLNRLDNPFDAYKALKRSFEMDPGLKRIAKVDGDVCDLLVSNEDGQDEGNSDGKSADNGKNDKKRKDNK